MNATLLTIGDELLIGQVLNSNAQWLSEKLTDLEISVSTHLTVGDTKEAIENALTHFGASDILIIGGGLGPTHDDITMEVLSSYYKMPLFYDKEWIEKVEAYFKARNRPMAASNQKQAYLLKNAKRIDNHWGTAAGQHFEVENSLRKKTQVFVIPGVPHEVKGMAEDYIFPFLKAHSDGSKILKRTLLVTGIGESALALKCAPVIEKLKKLQEQNKKITLAFLPSSTVVRLRLQMSVSEKSDEQIFNFLATDLIHCCEKDFYGIEPMQLEELIIQNFTKENQTLSIAESCTGGLISHRLTQVPGSSKVLKGALVAYSQELKHAELGITEEEIKKFGIVSESIAVKMAEAIRKKWNTTYGISSTGYLGPTGGDEFAAVGTIWVAVSSKNGSVAKMLTFENHRERNKERGAQAALDLLRRQSFGAK